MAKLLFAVWKKEWGTAKALLDAGHDANFRGSEDGEIALHWAARYGNLRFVQLMIAGKAAVDAQNHCGWTPLHYAALNGMSETIAELLMRGADVAIQADDGMTPKQRAENVGKLEQYKQAETQIGSAATSAASSSLQQAKVRDVKSDDEAADEHRRRKIPTPAASAPNSGDKTKRQKVLYGENEPTTSRVDDDDEDKTAEKPQRMTRGRVKDDDNTDADEPPAKRTQISDTYNVTSSQCPEGEDLSVTMPSSEKELSRLKVAQLRELCGRHRLKKTGNKADLRKRLREALFAHWNDDDDGSGDEADGADQGELIAPAHILTWEAVLATHRERTGSDWSKRSHTQVIEPKPRDSFKGQKCSVIYDAQKMAGDLVFEKIRAHLEKHEGGSLAERFSRFEVFVMLANFNTLEAQTRRRLADFVNKRQQDDRNRNFFPNGTGIEKNVFRPVKSASNDAVFKRLLEAAADNATLVLMIHDEAHFMAVAAGKVDDYLNHAHLRGKGNVVQLLVSATPYNLQTETSQIPPRNETDWPGAEASTCEYYGLQRFCETSQNKGATEGVIRGDDAFEKHCEAVCPQEYNAGGRRDVDNRVKAARRDALIEEYICAMMKHEGVDAIPEGKVSPFTQKIIDDLLDVPLERGDGSGIMVVIRVSPEAGGVHGRLLKSSLEATQHALGLDDRFAVILDIECKKPMRESIGHVMLERMRTWSDPTEPQVSRIDPKSYEDLLDLPVILILCEKGKMGDSFPKSFRHYDMRLRYSNSCESRAAVEQDLGRAFRYGPATQDYPFPTILVGRECAAELTKQKVNLLRLDPDAKMKMRKATGSGANENLVRTLFDGKPMSVAYPNQVAESSAKYRKYWKCVDSEKAKHYDCRQYTLSTNRFLLQGRPQIGKTGAFLHLIDRLFDYLKPKPVVFPIPEDIDLPGPDPHPEPAPEDNLGNMGPFPSFDALKDEEFKHPPNPGKYGDPDDAELWKYYVEDGNKNVHPRAQERSTARGATPAQLVPSYGLECQDSTTYGITGGGPVLPQCGQWHQSCFTSVAFVASTRSSVAGYSPHPINRGSKDAGMLWITPACKEKWWSGDDSLVLRSRSASHDGRHVLKFPVLIPSSGRPRQALLDLGRAMTLSGILCHGAGEVLEYLQIVTVKCCEREEYMRCCPDPNVVFFELPASANELGIGASRYHMKKLATSICPADFPFCFFLDDSVHYWKGIALPDDPEPMFGDCADDAAKMTDISLADVLMHFQSEPFASGDLRQLGIIGFHRIDGRNWSKAAYARRHVYSAIIMNLERLQGIDYREKCFLWEDLDFNKRASEACVVICKCYRFGMGKKPGMPGGCSDMVPRPLPTEIVPRRLADLNPPAMAKLVKSLFLEKYPHNPELADKVAEMFASKHICGRAFMDFTDEDLAEAGFGFLPFQRRFLLAKRAELEGEGGIPPGLLGESRS